MAQLNEFEKRILETATRAFVDAVDELNETASGTVYAAVAYLTDGIVAVGLNANTIEHLEQHSNASDVAIREVHPALFDTFLWKPFGVLNDALEVFHERYENGAFGFRVSPEEILLPLIIRAYRNAKVQERVFTTYQSPILGGVGYADPDPTTQHSHVVAISQQVNSTEWHQKILTTFPVA